ncbi:MAG: hypothetical protein OXC40_07450 [Proteobacteria bacterium]|nr:hypothetical protein [Pseudomonadota bacterium]
MPRKKMSFILGLGILGLPLIFGWFTLRQGYSTKIRIITFTWMFSWLAYSITTETDIVNAKKPHWRVSAYTDKFKDPTDNKYIYYHNLIFGNFSYSAASNLLLYPTFAVNSKEEIFIFLNLYRLNNPVKERSKAKYFVDIKTDQGEQRLIGYYLTDRISLDSKSSHILHQNFMNNVPIKFHITKDSQYEPLTSYTFTLKGSHHYSKVYKEFQNN